MQKDRLVIGILAHVDAGKTTLAEGLLYTCGSIRNLGRVDHQDAFLDNFSLERDRGITIFSKQAKLEWQDLQITLLDTPGHVDFSAEMERTLQVLDYAVLVISGADGVQGHVETLWRLLKRYEIPVFLFVNKMDQEGTDKQALLQEVQKKLDERCVEFNAGMNCLGNDACEEMADMGVCLENIAMCHETLMEEYLESSTLAVESIAEAIAERKIFPCYFGSALKLQGVDTLLNGIRKYTLIPEYSETFGARVFKITRDEAGNRLTYLKVTGGELRVKQILSEEKADQIRLYNGAKYQTTDCVTAGEICAVTGLKNTFAGQALGEESGENLPLLEPVLLYQLILPEEVDATIALGQLRQLEEEEPLLHILWKEESKEILVQVMGEVQIEVLKVLIAERFGWNVEFGTGSIVYKETIANVVEGIGHFEPLRHYAEVRLLLEPGEPGSGLSFATLCSEDVLDKNWQRLIMTHLEEKQHVGVLTGSEITDIRVLLTAGRAHAKHTEGGDFRQATYRALRQGLRQAKSVLLEPVFAFRLELPTEYVGRAMSDIQRMNGNFDAPITEGEITILTGSAPVATMGDYHREVISYTRGYGRLHCTLKGYEPCHNAEEVIERIGYQPEADLENPTGSVFCSHGAGFVVPWDEVESYAHTESPVRPEQRKQTAEVDYTGYVVSDGKSVEKESPSRYITQEEIEAIFAQTYGRKKEENNRYRRYHKMRRTDEFAAGSRHGSGGTNGGVNGGRTAAGVGKKQKGDYLLVDGYNIIFAWDELRELAERNIDSARDKLMDILSNYQGYLGHTLILVFDAYKVKGNPGSVQQYHNIYVVYTKEAETADQYIEKTVHDIGRDYNVTVATSDRLEQMIIWGNGALRMSAAGLKEAVETAAKSMTEQFMENPSKLGNRPFDSVDLANQ